LNGGAFEADSSSDAFLWSSVLALRREFTSDHMGLNLFQFDFHRRLSQTAKAELAKVRQQREFELQTINIQDEGQEKWKRKYVYWIPALHVDGKEVAKGRWDAQNVIRALDEWQATQQDISSGGKTDSNQS
jgi:hypothetical protein